MTDWLAPTAAGGRNALVTGAASGIGRATALLLARCGADVALVDLDAGRLEAVAAEIAALRRRGVAVPFDLARHDGIEAMVEAVSAQLGPVSILVNAAGITSSGTLLTEPLERWNQVFAVNVTAPFLLIQSVGRRMIEAGQGGNIVNVSSSSAFRAQAGAGAYGASKAALQSLTRTAAATLAGFDVNVNAVAPGVTRTGITEPIFGTEGLKRAVTEGILANFFHRVAEPDDVANAIVFLCLPASRQITGQVINTTAGNVVSAG